MADQTETGGLPAIDGSRVDPRTRASRKCVATTAAGTPCQSAPLHGDTFCLMHSPNVTHEQRQAVSRRGGEARKARGFATGPTKIKLPTPEVLCATIVDALSQARRGAMKASTAESICRMAATAIKSLDAVDTAKRLAALEAEVAELRKGAK